MTRRKMPIRSNSLKNFKPSRSSPLSDDESETFYDRRRESSKSEDKKKKRSLPSNQIEMTTINRLNEDSSCDTTIQQKQLQDPSQEHLHPSSGPTIGLSSPPTTSLSLSSATTNTTAAMGEDSKNLVIPIKKRINRQQNKQGQDSDSEDESHNRQRSNKCTKKRKLQHTNSVNTSDDNSNNNTEDSSSEEDYSNRSTIPPELLNRFKTFPLFQNAPKAFFNALARSLRLVQYNPQEYIVKAGEQAKSMYWILRGTVGVTSTDGESIYAELAAGSFFGEIGILFNRPRTATVVARTKVLLGVLTKDALSIVLHDYPTMERLIRDEGQERLAMQEKRKRMARMSMSVNRLPHPRETHYISSDNTNAINASGVAISYDQVPGPALPPLAVMMPHPYEQKPLMIYPQREQEQLEVGNPSPIGSQSQYQSQYPQRQIPSPFANQQPQLQQRMILTPEGYPLPSEQAPRFRQSYPAHQQGFQPPLYSQIPNQNMQMQQHQLQQQLLYGQQQQQQPQQLYQQQLYQQGLQHQQQQQPEYTMAMQHLNQPLHPHSQTQIQMQITHSQSPPTQDPRNPSLLQQQGMQDTFRPSLPLKQFTTPPVDNIDNSISTREFLRGLPIFKTLSSDVFHELALRVEIRDFRTMEYIFRKGSAGRHIYFVVYGEVEVLDPDLPNRIFARLGSGKYFGEMAFLSSLRDDHDKSTDTRSADIRAVSDCVVLIVKGDTLEDLCRRYPLVAEDMKATAGERLKINDSVGNLIHSTEITPQDRITVDSLIASHDKDTGDNLVDDRPLFKSISWRNSSFGSDSKPHTENNSITSDSVAPGVLLNEFGAHSREEEDNDEPEKSSNTKPGRDSVFTEATNVSSATNVSDDHEFPFRKFTFGQRQPPTATTATPIVADAADKNEMLRSPSPSASNPLPQQVQESLLAAPQTISTRRRSIQLSIPAMNPTRGSIYRLNNPARPPFHYTSHDQRLRLNSINRGRRRSSALTNGPLPDSLFLRIFSYLDLPNLMRMSSVCRRWKQLIYLGSDLFKTLDLTPWSRDLDDKGLIQITNFVGSRPEIIDISNCFHITDESFSYLINEVGIGGSIKELNMKNNWNISAMAIMDLSIVGSELSSIDLSNCRKVKDDVIDRLISSKFDSKFGCHQLTDLNLSYCKYLTDKTMLQIATNANERLRSLNLTRCTTITDNGFSFWAQTQFPNLKKLILRDCTFLSDNAITALASSCPNLQELDLTFCCVLTDNSLAILYLCCKFLKSLNLSFCGSAVSDNSLVSISRLPLLESLWVTGCIRVTRQGIDMLLSNSKSVKYLNLSQCPSVNIFQGTSVEPFEKKPGTRNAYLKVSPHERIVKVVL